MVAEAHLEALPRHPDQDQGDATPGVEESVNEAKLGGVEVPHAQGGQRGAEVGEAAIAHSMT